MMSASLIWKATCCTPKRDANLPVKTPFHLRIFSQRPDVTGIVHAHPPVMTGFAIANTDLLAKPTLPEPIIEVGPMLTVPYEEPLTDALAEAFDDKLPYANAFLMKNHGAIVVSSEE